MRRMDEMEAYIALRSVRWAWLFTVIALLVWSICDFIRTGSLTMPFYLLIIQNMVYFFTTQISRWKVGDEEGKKSVFWYVIFLAIGLAAFGFILLLRSR